MKLKINVTQKDIEKGGYGYSDCPPAQAIKRRLKTKVHKYVAVRPRSRNLICIGKTRIRLEGELLDFVDNYDKKKDKVGIKPISFELDVPEKYLK